MDIKQEILAKRYATAFLNLFIDKISLTDYGNIQLAEQFIKKHRHLFFLLKVPAIPNEIKKDLLKKFFEYFQLPYEFNKLINLLILQLRLFLLPDILQQISNVFRERKDMLVFDICTSGPLSEKQLDTIKHFLAAKTDKNILYRHSIDESLIAGLRMQSNIFLWEYSIKAQLRAAKKAIHN